MLSASGPRKRRTREHIIADLSVNFIERQALLCGFTTERVRGDYGYDLLLFTYDTDGCPEEGLVFIQAKATDHLRVSRRRGAVIFRIDVVDLRLWLSENIPVILVMYDAKADIAYWLVVQDYFAGEANPSLLKIKGSKSVYLPLTHQLDVAAMREIARIKKEKEGRFEEKVGSHD